MIIIITYSHNCLEEIHIHSQKAGNTCYSFTHTYVMKIAREISPHKPHQPACHSLFVLSKMARRLVLLSLAKVVNLVINGTKQGCVLAPTLFGIVIAATIAGAFRYNNLGININSRTGGGVFNLRRLKAKAKTFHMLTRELFFADECAAVAHTGITSCKCNALETEKKELLYALCVAQILRHLTAIIV